VRALGFLILFGSLASFGTVGCTKKKEAAPAPGGESGGVSERARGDSAKHPDRPAGDSTRPREEGGKRPDVLAAREAPAAGAMVADGPRRVEQKASTVPAGILTAGSFDDNLFPEPFRTFTRKLARAQEESDLPNRFLGRRLVVTVRNGDGRPVGNARLQVRPAEGGPGVNLVTRTDGRAVFLSSWDGVPADADLLLTVTPPDGGPAVTRRAAPGLSSVEVALSGAAPAPLHLDLAIVLDTTGSMGDELEFLKAEFRSIVSAVAARFPNVRQRYALVLYRDEGDEYVSRAFPFTASLDAFRKHLEAQRASGGGNYPEAMHRGLEDAAQLVWREDHTARVLFLVGDAPPHARHGRRTLEALDTLRKRGVVVYPVAASGYDPACEFVMRSGALLTGGQFLFLTDDSGVGNAHAEPHIPHYHVERLNHLMVRMIASELSGRRVDPDREQIVRTVGQPVQVGADQ
jgi:hypothetical protein